MPVKVTMPRRPAARVADHTSCPQHGGGDIIPPCSPTTFGSNGLPRARATDKAQCKGPIDIIVTGVRGVYIDGLLATREGEKCMHGGEIIPPCDPKIFVEGPSQGVVVGNPEAARKACIEAAKGRKSGSTRQSTGNCGLESSRQLINEHKAIDVDEEELLEQHTGIAKKYDPDTYYEWEEVFREGGSTAYTRQVLLGSMGIGSDKTPQYTKQSQLHQGSFGVPTIKKVSAPDLGGIVQGVAEGKGVITSHAAGKLWGTSQEGSHAILTTGARYNAQGEVVSVFVNDTGTGECAQELDADTYEKSLIPDKANVTGKSIW